MDSTKDKKEIEEVKDRREFFQGVASGAAGMAMLAAAGQLGVPILSAAQGEAAKSKPDAVSGASIPKPNPRPDDGTKYGKHLLKYDGAPPKFGDYTGLNSLPPFEEIASPQTYFRGAIALPGAPANIGWQIFKAPVCWETPHTHKYEELIMFLGAEPPDFCNSFDAEIDFWLGEEFEKHTITTTTILHIPAGLMHCPMNIRVVRKPFLFQALYLGPNLDSVRMPNFDLNKFDFGGPVNLKTFGPPSPKTKA